MGTPAGTLRQFFQHHPYSSSSTENEYILVAMSGIMAVPKWDPTLRWLQLLTFFKYDDYIISDSWIIAAAHVQASQNPRTSEPNAHVQANPHSFLLCEPAPLPPTLPPKSFTCVFTFFGCIFDQTWPEGPF